MRMMKRRWVEIMMRSSTLMMVGKAEMMMKEEEEGMITRLMGRLWSFEGNIFIHYGGTLAVWKSRM